MALHVLFKTPSRGVSSVVFLIMTWAECQSVSLFHIVQKPGQDYSEDGTHLKKHVVLFIETKSSNQLRVIIPADEESSATYCGLFGESRILRLLLINLYFFCSLSRWAV